jgi:hypothetical protein
MTQQEQFRRDMAELSKQPAVQSLNQRSEKKALDNMIDKSVEQAHADLRIRIGASWEGEDCQLLEKLSPLLRPKETIMAFTSRCMLGPRALREWTLEHIGQHLLQQEENDRDTEAKMFRA